MWQYGLPSFCKQQHKNNLNTSLENYTSMWMRLRNSHLPQANTIPRGVLPHNTSTGMRTQLGHDFGTPDLERGIHFQEWGIIFCTNKSSSNYQQPFEIIHREFALKNMLTSKSNSCTLCCARYVIWNWSNKVAYLCRSSIVIYGCIGQPNKENNFSKQWAIEIY